MYLELVYLYLIFGIIMSLNDIDLPGNYIFLILFFGFKWIFNYRKCTISYVECKLRGVKKENGYLYSLLKEIIDLRYSEHIYCIGLLCGLLLYYHFVIKGHKLNFF